MHMAGSVVASVPAAFVMERLGQQRGYLLGALLGALGCCGVVLI